MAKTSKTLQVSFGGFSCTLEGFEDPVQAMRAVTEYLRDLSTRDPSFADRIGLAAAPPPTPPAPPSESRVSAPLATLLPPVAPPAPTPPVAQMPPTPVSVPPVAVPVEPIATAPEPVVEPLPAPDVADPVAADLRTDALEAEETAEDDTAAEGPAVDSASHPGLHRLLSATPEGEEEELSRILSRADDQLADPEAARRRGLIAQLKAAVAATEAERALGESEPGPQARQGAFRLDLSEAVREQPPVSPRPEQAPLRLVAAQRVDTPADPDPSEEDVEDEQDSLPVRRPGSFRVFASEMSAAGLPDLLEAAAAWLCFVDERESVSRAQLLALASEALDEAPEREEGLRAFGLLLREGRVVAVAGGRYRVSDGSRFHPARLAG